MKDINKQEKLKQYMDLICDEVNVEQCSCFQTEYGETIWYTRAKRIFEIEK